MAQHDLPAASNTSTNTMIADYFAGASYVYRGFGLLRYQGLRRFVLLPLLVNVLVFGGGTWWGFSALESWLDHALPGWLAWAQFILLPLFTLTALIVMFYTFTLLATLIASPFNSLLSEKIERRLAGEIPDSKVSLFGVMKETGKAVASESRKLLYMAAWVVPLLILFLIPGLNLLAPFLWGMFGAWMLAFAYIDYPMGNHGMTFPDEKRFLKKNRGLALGFGSAMLLMTFIPVLNFLAMPAGVAGATLLWVERLKPGRSTSHLT